ncbi:hypothetical protein EMPG_17323 [Blastomyces silverae]|uniref:Uncharacterized protein n=1 Tax=Blastomyces silverae TaxID=2060906 RepID=A0A0H1B708_9EURO|nr:hypothetical protein EMPG_17323 [Blastomyces silverae]
MSSSNQLVFRVNLEPRNITTNSSLSAGGVSHQSRARIPGVGCRMVTSSLPVDRHFMAKVTWSSEVA